jgi:CRISPR-associated protein Cas5t
MLYLYLEAPFAAFRNFTAGSFRPTADFITYSAAYGLLLNITGIEMRHESPILPMTLIKTELPRFRLAIGALSFPQSHTLLQQLHNYPVGNTGKEKAYLTMGTKYNIQPVKRAFLSDIRAYLCIDGDEGFESKILRGLNGESTRTYGVPFLGDNNYLISKIKAVDTLKPAYWFERIISEPENGMPTHVMRLTITIDREDMSRTKSALFAPTKEPSTVIPEDAWVEVGY